MCSKIMQPYTSESSLWIFSKYGIIGTVKDENNLSEIPKHSTKDQMGNFGLFVAQNYTSLHCITIGHIKYMQFFIRKLFFA